MSDISVMGKLVCTAQANRLADDTQIYDPREGKFLNAIIEDLYNKIVSGVGGDTINVQTMPDPTEYALGALINLQEDCTVPGSYMGSDHETVSCPRGLYRIENNTTVGNYWGLFLSIHDSEAIGEIDSKLSDLKQLLEEEINGKADSFEVDGTTIVKEGSTIRCNLDTKVFVIDSSLPATPTVIQQKYIWIMVATVTVGGVTYEYDPDNGLHAFIWNPGSSSWNHIGLFASTVSDPTKVAIAQGLSNAHKILTTNSIGNVVCTDGEVLTAQEKNDLLALAAYLNVTDTIESNDSAASTTYFQYDGNTHSVDLKYKVTESTKLGSSTVLGKKQIAAVDGVQPNLMWSAQGANIQCKNGQSGQESNPSENGMYKVTSGVNIGTYSGNVKCSYNGVDLTAITSKKINIYTPWFTLWGKTVNGDAPTLTADVLNAALTATEGTRIVTNTQTNFWLDKRGRVLYDSTKCAKVTQQSTLDQSSGYVLFVCIPHTSKLFLDRPNCIADDSFAIGLNDHILFDDTKTGDLKYRLIYNNNSNEAWRVYNSEPQQVGKVNSLSIKLATSTEYK